VTVPQGPQGGAYLASVKEWGFPTEQLPDREVTVSNTAPTLILRNDPERIGALIVNQDADAGRISRRGNVTTTTGIPLDGSGGVISIIPRSDGEGVGREWWGIIGGAADGTWTVIEIRRRNA